MKQTVEEAKREYIEKYVSRNEYASFGAAFEAGVKWQMEEERQVCDKCGGRLALVTGTFFYSPHAEPYESGVVEEPIATEGETWVGAYKCDKCGHIQNLFTE